MPELDDRFSRQRILAEVGAAGQAKIAGARLALAPEPGVDIELEYLRRAGVGSAVVEPELAPQAFPFAAEFEFVATRTLARAAWSALDHLRNILAPFPR
jgi:hypothetical protein